MNKNFDDDDHHYMNNTNNSNPRVIQIPVHHYTPSNNNNNGSNTGSLPKTSTTGFDGGLGDHKQKHSQDFFNRNPNHQGIFDEFQSPFDLIDSPIHRNRSLFNRDQPFGSRFDEFFRPNLTSQPHHHSSADQFLNRDGKSPNRELPHRQVSPAPDAYINSDINRNTHRQSPTVFRTESPRLRTESPYNAGYQIPVQHREFFPSSDFSRLRTESPIRQPSPSPSSGSKQPSPPLQTDKQLKQPIVLPEPPQKIPKQVHVDKSTGSDFIKQSAKPNTEQPTSQPTSSAKHKHIPKPNPVINLPKVIPLPDPHPEKTACSANTQESKDMGNTFQGQGSHKRNAGAASDFAQAHQSSPQPETAPHHPPATQPPVKTQQEKLDDIATEIERLQIELTTIKPGCGKKDKHYLVLEELLTRCLLRLDEIEKTDEIKDLRKSLIVASNKLLDQLESIALETKSENEGNSDMEPPSSKRPKSPKTEDGDSSTTQSTEPQSNETAATTTE